MIMGNNTIIVLALFCINFIFGNSLPNENLNTIAVYWDASCSQKDKDIQKEFDFLDAYFKAYPSSKVKLVIFNSRIISEDSIEVKSSNWNVIQQKLKAVVYDGASDFSLINTEISEQMILLFTDGNSNFGDFQSSLYSPRIITISSTPSINKKFLHKTAFYNRGYYVNLLETDTKTAIKAIKDEAVLPRLEFVTEKNLDINKKYVEGVVISEGNALPDVNITVKGKNKGTITDQYGKYKIAVEVGDVLVFTNVNMKKAIVDIKEEDEIVQVELTKKINKLDAAVIKSRKKRAPNRGTLNGVDVNLDAIGYAVQSIDEKQMGNQTKIGIGESIAGKFAGISNNHSNDPGRILIRGWHSIMLSSHPLIIVDGISMPRSGIYTDEKADYNFIDNNTVTDITILKGISATNRYGTEGRNGVILITTNSTGNKLLANDEESPDDELNIKYEIFKLPLQVDTKQNSNFITMLKKYPDAKEAYSYYLNRFSANKDNVSFFVECSDYFFSINQPDIGEQILSNLAEIYPDDTSILKILAFNLEKHNVLDSAQKVYERIAAISPTMSQAHVDLANSYFSVKKYQKAVDLFKKITSNRVKEIPSFDGLSNQVTNDFKNLLSKRNQKWKVKKIDQKYFIPPHHDLRVVTEWSHPQTEFSVQYINAKKQYFTLNHTQAENKKTLQKELRQGFTSDEYVLSDIEPGAWYLNIVTPTNYVPDLKSPKFLKIKVFTNFGRSNQKLQTHVINLDRIVRNKIITSFTL